MLRRSPPSVVCSCSNFLRQSSLRPSRTAGAFYVFPTESTLAVSPSSEFRSSNAVRRNDTLGDFTANAISLSAPLNVVYCTVWTVVGTRDVDFRVRVYFARQQRPNTLKGCTQIVVFDSIIKQWEHCIFLRSRCPRSHIKC